MDGRSFDALTRRWGAGQSRRLLLKGMIGGAALVAVGRGSALAKPPTENLVTICDNGTEVQVEEKAVERYLRKHPNAFVGSCTVCYCWDRYDPDEQALYGSLCFESLGGLCSSGTQPGCTKDADCAGNGSYTTCVSVPSDWEDFVCNDGGGMCAYGYGEACTP
jgi:hypothetical protein